MDNLWQDLRYGMRTQATTPGFTVIAVLTVALGIGANTAIFSVLDSVLLRSLPVTHPEQLTVLSNPDDMAPTLEARPATVRGSLIRNSNTCEITIRSSRKCSRRIAIYRNWT
jgi:hypothetical protein